MKKLITLCILLLFFRCGSEDPSERRPIQGTWIGTLDSNRIIEYKVYSEVIDDSLTKLVDSVYTMENIEVNFGRERVRFLGLRPIISSSYLYSWDGGDTILFHKENKQNIAARPAHSASSEVFIYPMRQDPHAEIIKRDRDSLVIRLTVYTNYFVMNDNWKQYILKLKRK